MKSYRIILLCLIFFILSSSNVFPCYCKPLGFKKAYKRYDLIFSAKVLTIDKVEVETLLNDHKTYTRKVTMLVKDYYKGNLCDDTITIYTGFGNGDCGFNFEVGKLYIVYPLWKEKFVNNDYYPKVKKFLFTSICTRTNRLDKIEKEELEYLEKKKKKMDNTEFRLKMRKSEE